MSEKEIIKSKSFNCTKILIFSLIVIAGLFLFTTIYQYASFPESECECFSYCDWRQNYMCNIDDEKSFNFFIKEAMPLILTINGGYWDGLILYIGIPIVLLFYFYNKQMQLVVTNKRVYGKSAFGKRVDLPLDSISSVSIIKFLKGISIGTSSGKVGFLLITNNIEIHEKISELLLKRQNSNDNKLSNVDELKKYKELLDSGVINKEEFEKKKNQLLDL